MAKDRPYHHGDLKRAALEEALRQLDRVGVDQISMRSIAAELGVAHRALYNHFGDREGMVSALAAEGFARLARVLTENDGAEAHLRSYAWFALDNPALYDVMMRQAYPGTDKTPALREAIDEVINVSLNRLATKGKSKDDRRREVMRVWMLAHGGVSLHQRGILRDRSKEHFVEELTLIARLKGPMI